MSDHRNRVIERVLTIAVVSVVVIVAVVVPTAASGESEKTFLEFVKSRTTELRARDEAPSSLDDWQRRRGELRAQLLAAWGGFPERACPLNPRILGTLERDGYRIEKVIFQTMPDVWMTANAYVPDQTGKLPTVLCVHGHWRGAKQDPNVQARCIGLVKLGFFVLAVDAFGAGERGVGKALGEYHGEMVAATLWPVGRPLSGLQVYENQRAVDYLLARPEVDGARLGVTGASGGGNQTMYAGAWDERFKAVVPVCSVGNYQAYLGAACCMCEVVPGALEFTEEWGVLSLTAPRALMVINATRDAFQFSVGEAKKSLAFVEPVYRLHGRPENVRHTVFESPHAYNRPMREAMYGWMTRHLKGEGDGSPVPEPEIKTEEPETLRCFPGETRADDWMTIPKFAAREGSKLALAVRTPTSTTAWREMADGLRVRLDQDVLGGTEPKAGTKPSGNRDTSESQTLEFEAEPGVRLNLTHAVGKPPRRAGVVIFLSLEGAVEPAENELAISSLERTCDRFVEPEGGGASVITKWEQIDEFGWRHFGDTFADNERSPGPLVRDFPKHHFGSQPISHFGNEYDVSYTVLLQGIRRANPRWMWMADVLCRHYADVCIYHTEADGAAAYRHGPFTHTTHDTAAFRSTHRMYPSETHKYGLRYASGGPNAGHCYVASLAEHYYLTGDRVSREALLEVADWAVDSPWFRNMMMGDKRGIGNLLMTHVYAYQLTKDRKYYDAAVKMIDYVEEPFEGLGANLFVKAAGRFLDMKIENDRLDADYREALGKLLRFGDLYLTLPDDLPRRYLEQTCFYAELLFTCYLHAPGDHPHRERYYAKGTALMDHAQQRWPGTYRPTKTLTMCFANTGAFFRAIAMRDLEARSY